jgi:hypothetical protein
MDGSSGVPPFAQSDTRLAARPALVDSAARLDGAMGSALVLDRQLEL